jgi:hypothetical protein
MTVSVPWRHRLNWRPVIGYQADGGRCNGAETRLKRAERPGLERAPLPGATALPAMIYYRTRHTGKPALSVRINDVTVTQYTFVDGDEAERTWHEIIPASTNAGPALRPDNNELVFFARDGSVVFGDVVIVYTSNQTTIPIPVTTARP